MNISPKFSALYVFSPEKTQGVLQFKDAYDLKHSGKDALQQNEEREALTAEANALSAEESKVLNTLTGDDTFTQKEAKSNCFISDHQGRVDGPWLRGGVLSDGRLFVATNPTGKLTGKFDAEPKDTDDDVTFWNQVQHRINMVRWEQVTKDPNMERMDQATEQLIPDTVFLEAQMSGRKINEIG